MERKSMRTLHTNTKLSLCKCITFLSILDSVESSHILIGNEELQF